DAALAPVPDEVVAALRSLKGADAAGKRAAFDVLAARGDVRLLPALRAYASGLLIVRGDAVLRYGDRATVPGRPQPVLPILDAVTGEPVLAADGAPEYAEKVENALVVKRPLTAGDRRVVNDLIAALSLNDPDPARRRDAIVSAGDRTDESLLKPLRDQLAADPSGPFAWPLRESLARIELAKGDAATKLAAANALGELKTGSALVALQRARDASENADDTALQTAVARSIAAAERYQSIVRGVQHTFAGLSLASILILLALGLSIIFGLMGVINMAHGEFMMIGAFTTYCVATFFRGTLPAWFDYYPLVAVPAAFVVAGAFGLLCEWAVIRHLYGRPLETLLATWGIGLVLIQLARVIFGDTLSYGPPSWMSGGVELAPDLVLPKNRVIIIGFCVTCIALVYFVVRRTKLGLLLRATTQNREMAAALGVGTRRVDALTFAFGTGLAGLAGTVVPLFDKINPQMGQSYIVDSFLVVVTGGVGNLAGVLWTGLGLGFISKYLEPLIGGTGGAIYTKIGLLALIIVFLNFRPSGLFPAKGRTADA
ncbi:MAG TPA: urea ABC transporter permease subunit UrtB, partial [Tepidisphaeraceae bacterium]|nr:urea ABC transporter permease subunit UrtB [Tepidisphaeraceae bacterium]